MQHVPPDRNQTDRVFYVTIATQNRRPIFADPRAATIAVDSLAFYARRREALLIGYVIMPDHIHGLVQPKPPLILPAWAGRFKSFTTHALTGTAFWQEGYWSEIVVSKWFLRQKLMYIHANPVRAGLAEDPSSYLWSSAREYDSGAFQIVTPYWEIVYEDNAEECGGMEPAT